MIYILVSGQGTDYFVFCDAIVIKPLGTFTSKNQPSLVSVGVGCMKRSGGVFKTNRRKKDPIKKVPSKEKIN